MGLTAIIGLLFVALLIMVVLRSLFRHSFRNQSVRGPMTLPILGVPLAFVKESYLPKTLGNLHQQYGSVFEFEALGQRLIVFSRPSDIEKLLLSSIYTGRIATSGEEGLAQVRFSMRGIVFNNNYEGWKAQRKVFQRGLRPTWLQEAIPVILDMSKQAMQHVTTSQPQMKAGVIDLQAFTTHTAVTTILKIAFGEETSSQEMDQLMSLLFAQFHALSYFLHTPPWLWKLIPKHKALANQHRSNSKQLSDFIDQIMAKRRVALKDTDKENHKNANFISQLLLEMREDSSITDADANQLAIEMLTAGSDTTATGIIFTLLLLAEHPQFQDRCRAEIRSVLPQLASGATMPSMNDINKLSFVEQCILEAIRIVPEVPIIGRMAHEDGNVNGVAIRKNDSILVYVTPNHMDPTQFAEPTRYDPELHFADDAVAKRHKYAFLPFGAGPKICPGQFLAMLEMKVVIAWTLANYRFSLFDSKTTASQVPKTYATVQSPSGAVPIRIEKL